MEEVKSEMFYAEIFARGFEAGRKQGQSEGYELGLQKGKDCAWSDIADIALKKMEGRK